MQSTLIVNATIPGMMRPEHIDVLESLAHSAELRKAYHLASVLRGMAAALRDGHAVRIESAGA